MISKNPISRLLLAGSAVGALALVPISFLPWVEIHSYSGFPPATYTQDVSGNELYGFTDLRDETLAVVSMAALGATLFLLVGRGRQFAAAIVASAGVAVCALALYGALHNWRPKYFNPHVTVTDVDATLALWTSFALGLILCVSGLALIFVLNGKAQPKLRPSPSQP